MIDKLKKKFGSVDIPLKTRIFNAGYGIGASVVILGALFKLMYWEGANEMLTIGMLTEAIIFAVSAFERPLKTYEWDRIFDFQNGKTDLSLNGSENNRERISSPAANAEAAPAAYRAPEYAPANVPNAYPGVSTVEGLSDDDAQKLSKSINDLAKTASQLNEIAGFSLETEKFAQSIRTISENTAKYADNQDSLIEATQNLQNIYQRIGSDTEKIEINTQEYKSQVERINSNLSGMNSIYEIQLKDIYAQSVHFHNQTEISKKMSDEMNQVTGEIGKLKNISDDFSLATEKLKTNANELADNIAKLNQIYGNMLNAMS